MSDAAINKIVKKSTEPKKGREKYFMPFFLLGKVIRIGLSHSELIFNTVESRFFLTSIGDENWFEKSGSARNRG